MTLLNVVLPGKCVVLGSFAKIITYSILQKKKRTEARFYDTQVTLKADVEVIRSIKEKSPSECIISISDRASLRT